MTDAVVPTNFASARWESPAFVRKSRIFRATASSARTFSNSANRSGLPSKNRLWIISTASVVVFFCRMSGSLFMGVFSWILFKSLFPFDRPVNFLWGDCALLNDPVGENRGDLPVEKVKNPVVDSLQPDAQFVDLITQQIGFRASQFMA